jgi:hypothetical protein
MVTSERARVNWALMRTTARVLVSENIFEMLIGMIIVMSED